MAQGDVRIVAVGDIQPNRERPETLLEKLLPDFQWGELRYCQVECVISDKGVLRSDVRNPAHRVPPSNVRALTSVGINVVSYAGNNNLDYGIEGFTDTLDRFTANGIKYFGAGDNLEQARRPLVVEANGVRIAWVDFCSILRDGYQATPRQAGISPLKVKTFYEPLENIYEQPGTPCRTVTVPDYADFETAMAMVRRAKSEADVVIGCFHWGVHFTHDLAMYQAEVGYAAIDNGCDLVLGTHPHCLQAVDVYKGKYIFYSLGNLAFEQPEEVAQRGVGEYLAFYGIPIEKDLKRHPHPRHCRQSMLLKIQITDKKIAGINFMPVYFTDDARPEIQEPGTPMHEEIMSLMERLCDEVGTKVERHGREGSVLLEKTMEFNTLAWLKTRNISYPWVRRLSTANNQ